MEGLQRSGNAYAGAIANTYQYMKILVDAKSTGDETLSVGSLEMARDRLTRDEAFNFETQLMLLSVGIAIASERCKTPHTDKVRLKQLLQEVKSGTFEALLRQKNREFEASHKLPESHELLALISALSCWLFITRGFTGETHTTILPTTLLFKPIELKHIPPWKFDDPAQFDDVSFTLQDGSYPQAKGQLKETWISLNKQLPCEWRCSKRQLEETWINLNKQLPREWKH